MTAQPYLGSTSRASHNHPLRLQYLPRALQVSCFPQHRPVNLRGLCWLHLSFPRYRPRLSHSAHLPKSQDLCPSTTCGSYVLTGIPLWLRFPSSHRLHNFHPGEVLQIASRNVLTYHLVPKKISTLQVSCRSCCHVWSRSLHFTCRLCQSTFQTFQSLHESRPEYCMGTPPFGGEPALRWTHEYYAGLHLSNLPRVQRPRHDVCKQHHEHASDVLVSCALSLSCSYGPR
jgi:hypothetical protein